MNKKKTLHKILKPQPKHWVGNGFYVSTMFSTQSEDYQHITPFLLMDHASPHHFPPTQQKLGVGEHPHRGFETVTFAIQGAVDHRDSGGGGGTIETGGVQWMTAGSGVVHEEFHSRQFAKEGGIFEMVQLWVNLPAKDKMTTPRYQSMAKEDFPLIELEGAKIKLIAGHFLEYTGPAKTHTPMTIFEIENPAKTPLQFTDETNTLVVQLKGESHVNGHRLAAGEVAIFQRQGQTIEMEGDENTHALILNGEPIDEPVASYGPFVMNTRDQILQAIRDYESGKMGRLVNN